MKIGLGLTVGLTGILGVGCTVALGDEPGVASARAPDETVGVTSEAAVLGHKSVFPMPQNASASALTWAPEFSFDQGCTAYAAVDANGNTNGGLNSSGAEGGECRDAGLGQTYTREQGFQNGVVAHMYALYFPKDNGYPFPFLGHRHDLESVVVWVRNDAQLLGVSYSAHGSFDNLTTGIPMHGTHPLVTYHRDGVTHAFGPTSKLGVTPSVIAWARLPAAARTALTVTDFGSAIFPEKDGRFEQQLGLARGSLVF